MLSQNKHFHSVIKISRFNQNEMNFTTLNLVFIKWIRFKKLKRLKTLRIDSYKRLNILMLLTLTNIARVGLVFIVSMKLFKTFVVLLFSFRHKMAIILEITYKVYLCLLLIRYYDKSNRSRIIEQFCQVKTLRVVSWKIFIIMEKLVKNGKKISSELRLTKLPDDPPKMGWY